MMEPSTTQPTACVQTFRPTVKPGQGRDRQSSALPLPGYIPFCNTELAVMRGGVGLPPWSETKALDQEM